MACEGIYPSGASPQRQASILAQFGVSDLTLDDELLFGEMLLELS